MPSEPILPHQPFERPTLEKAERGPYYAFIAGYAAGKSARLDVTAAVAYQEGRRASDDRLEDAATPPE